MPGLGHKYNYHKLGKGFLKLEAQMAELVSLTWHIWQSCLRGEDFFLYQQEDSLISAMFVNELEQNEETL